MRTKKYDNYLLKHNNLTAALKTIEEKPTTSKEMHDIILTCNQALKDNINIIRAYRDTQANNTNAPEDLADIENHTMRRLMQRPAQALPTLQAPAVINDPIIAFIEKYLNDTLTQEECADFIMREFSDTDLTTRGISASYSLAHVAAEMGNVDFLNRVLDDPNIRTHNSLITPLMLANDAKTIKAILAAKGDLCCVDTRGIPAYFILYEKLNDGLANSLTLQELITVHAHLKTLPINRYYTYSKFMSMKLDLAHMIQRTIEDKLHNDKVIDIKSMYACVDLYRNNPEKLISLASAHSARIIDFSKAIPGFPATLHNAIDFFNGQLTLSTIYALIALKSHATNLKELFLALEAETFYYSQEKRQQILLPLAQLLTQDRQDEYPEAILIQLMSRHHQIRKIAIEDMINGDLVNDELMATDNKNDGTASKEYYSAISEALHNSAHHNIQFHTEEYKVWSPESLGVALFKVRLPYIHAVNQSLEGFLRCIPCMAIDEQEHAMILLNTISEKITNYNQQARELQQIKDDLADLPENIAAKKAICTAIPAHGSLTLMTLFKKLRQFTYNSSKKGHGNEYTADEHWLKVAKLVFIRLWEQTLNEEQRATLADDTYFCTFMKILTNNGADFTAEHRTQLYTKYPKLHRPAGILCTDIAQGALEYALNQPIIQQALSTTVPAEDFTQAFAYTDLTAATKEAMQQKQALIDTAKNDAQTFLSTLLNINISRPHAREHWQAHAQTTSNATITTAKDMLKQVTDQLDLITQDLQNTIKLKDLATQTLINLELEALKTDILALSKTFYNIAFDPKKAADKLHTLNIQFTTSIHATDKILKQHLKSQDLSGWKVLAMFATLLVGLIWFVLHSLNKTKVQKQIKTLHDKKETFEDMNTNMQNTIKFFRDPSTTQQNHIVGAPTKPKYQPK